MGSHFVLVPGEKQILPLRSTQGQNDSIESCKAQINRCMSDAVVLKQPASY
jgi:hypothetical protein